MYTFNCIYFYGFDSSSKSAKGQHLTNLIDLTIPNLNRGDFPYLTLTLQLEQVRSRSISRKKFAAIYTYLNFTGN